MKLLFAAAMALSLIFTGLLGVNTTTKPTVTSIRAFEEPLIAIGGDQSANQDNALIAALHTYQKRKSYEDVSAITMYLDANAQSPWRFSLLANLGIIYRKTGHFSKAIDSWEQAWTLGKGEKNIQVQALANQVAADLASLLSSLGRTERLTSLLAETKGRRIYGSTNAMLMATSENLWLMKNKPGISFKCGPYALDSIRTFANRKDAHDKLIRDAQSSTKGFSLTQVRDLSNNLKMNYQMAKRQPGAVFIIPSVAHWKSGHFAALLKKEGDLYLTKDPTFGQEIFVTVQALEDESSGYYLVPPGPLPSGWQTIDKTEGDTIWGRGFVTNRAPGALKPDDKQLCKCPPCHGMAVYNAFLMLGSLSIQDNPVGYTPPVGPDVQFGITYNQLEADQPATFSFFNFGPSWNCSWLSYVTVPTSSPGTAWVNTRGGGQETYSASTYTSTGTTYSGYVGYYGNEPQSQATLWVTTSGTYERRLPDGSKEVFGLIDGTIRVFLTAIIDPHGNSITFQYMTDGSFRLQTVTDSSSLTTTLSYGLAPTTPDLTNPLTYLVTQITDPYARSATFNYSTSSPYQLTSIVDVIGITSSFTYNSGSSAITQMTTPYGTTTFSTSASSGSTRALTVTEPDGSQIALESRIDANNYPYPYSDAVAPSGYGLNIENNNLENRDTYYWDKKAMEATSDNPESDYTKAHIYHFLHTPDGAAESPVLESEKPALESRIWYNYPNQLYGFYEGTSDKPTIIARVVDSSGTTQAWQYQYAISSNPAAVTTAIDPIGRQTNLSYYSNGIDLETVTQNTASGTDTLLNITSYNSQHEPLTVIDAAGKTTSYAYNSVGQITSVTPPTRSGHSAEATTYSYTYNYLTSISGPLSGATKTMTYDTLGGNTVNRIKTMADAESYTLTYSYDNLDRVTQILYPDSTTETFSYLNPTTSAVDLDLHSSTDRLTRTTTRVYDSVRHLTSITDPLSRTTRYGWCTCGAMISLTDAKSNITYFNRDVESRLTSKVYPGGTQPPSTPDYTYDTVGHLLAYTDKRGDVATYSYNLDNTISGLSYSLASGTAATSNLAYGYDSYYPRLTSVGGVSLTYNAAGSLGAGKPLTITNALTGGSAAITYTYDEWGRVVGSNIDSANLQSVVLDSLGRVTNVLNLLAPTTPGFAYTYFDPTHPTNRIASIAYPTGQSTVYNYFGNTGDERLEEIKNLNPSSAVLSQNDYTYYAMGEIHTWQQQTDSNTPLLWTDGYDTADQLTSAVLTNTAITSPTVLSDSYGYDAAGNLNSSSLGGVSRSPSANALNQLTGSTPSGNRTVGFTGLLNGAATVTVNGSSATTNSGFYFSGAASLTPASTNTVATVPVVATDAHSNVRTNNYQTIVPAEPSYSPTYDSDGNELTSGAGQTYMWDAKNELASIVYSAGPNSGNHTEFAYDALGRRIAIVERTGTTVGSGTVTSTKQLVWNGSAVAEERNVSNTVIKRFFAQGEQIGSTVYYYTRDHLGSIREMLNSSGTIVARYSYDPYGRTTLVSGSNLATFQYANYYAHQASGLEFAVYRAYDPSTGRWLGRDPVAERGGLNLYGYVGNNPFDREDPLGLCQCCLAEANALYDSAWQLLNDVSSAASGWGAPGMGNPEPPSGGEVAKEEAVKTLADMAGAEGTGGALTLEEIIFDLPGIINGQTIKGDAQSVRSAETAYNSCIKKQQSNPQCSFSEAQSKAQKAGTLIQRSTDLFNSKPGSEERRRATQGYPYYPKT